MLVVWQLLASCLEAVKLNLANTLLRAPSSANFSQTPLACCMLPNYNTQYDTKLTPTWTECRQESVFSTVKHSHTL